MRNSANIKILSPLILALTLSACGDDGNDGTAGRDGKPGQDGVDGQDLTADQIQLAQIGRYTDEANEFDESAAEIVAFDPSSARLFVVNSQAGQVDVLDLQDPASPVKAGRIDASERWPDAGGVNSVAVANGLVAVAVENDSGADKGRVQIYNASDLSFRSQADVGVLPDMVAFTPNGQQAVVANEGEPSDDYSEDPEGSISIVDLNNPDTPTVKRLGFADFNQGGSRSDELPEDVRIFGNFGRTELTVAGFTDADPATITVGDATPITANDWFTLASSEGDPLPYQVDTINGNTLTLTTDFDGDSEVSDSGAAGLTVYLHDGASSVAQDLEPEYIAVSPDGTTAWATLQENNAVAVIDLENQRIDRIQALGTKDHSIPGYELDPSDNDDGLNIASWPLQGMFMPDAISAFTQNGQTYYITANEGDSREYDAFVEEIGMEDAPKEGALSDSAFNNDEKLGDIATTLTADTDGNGALDEPLVFGARSFSIWGSQGQLVADSGNELEVITAQQLGENFNNDNDENDGDSRSDAKGPEPEAVTTAQIDGQTYAFIGLERVGGIMVYNVSNPAAPEHVQYINNRDFDANIEDDIDDGSQPAFAAGDLGPESVLFVPASESPSDQPLLVVGNEVSGTTTIYAVQ
ncbi:alkaline phosphatase [Tamilnaduibacter salinus]|uniref:Alkaline phosphatase n=1 Tax=Tamilnaduibacter salinus TaxID=1484056 RepID=A0A2A2I116_9GAMM|nr:choice-of-anchor I family protein [Tamilnaduibacter salinus]PAV25721.1 alkaline phosphatase [Tamilnaduibacter salinus]